MPCFHPLKAWRRVDSRFQPVADDKKMRFGELPPGEVLSTRSILYHNSVTKIVTVYDSNSRKVVHYMEMLLPCHSCVGCRLRTAFDWTVRGVHESSLYEKNCFLTLTYNNENLPSDGSVSVREMQLFLKRLRKFFSSEKIRYFACGEYGTKLQRPHYHLILFGFDFQDKAKFIKRNGYDYFISDTLSKIWTSGYSLVAGVSPESIGYVCRYSLKKVSGPYKTKHYGWKNPEFILFSRRPGLGHDWYISNFNAEEFSKDVFILNNKYKAKPPKYYDKLFDELDHDLFLKVKEERFNKAMEMSKNLNESILSDKEFMTKYALGSYTRIYEESPQPIPLNSY